MRVRRSWLLVGGMVAVAGLLLAYVPVNEEQSSPQYIPSASSEYVIDYSAPLDLLFPRVSFTVSWNATENGTLVNVSSCGSDPNCGHPASAPLATGHGRTGRLTFIGAANTYYLIVPAEGAATFTISYSTPLLGGAVGFGGVLAGAVLVALGFVPPRPPSEEEGEEEPAREA
jgi:hypothetical protein